MKMTEGYRRFRAELFRRGIPLFEVARKTGVTRASIYTYWNQPDKHKERANCKWRQFREKMIEQFGIDPEDYK